MNGANGELNIARGWYQLSRLKMLERHYGHIIHRSRNVPCSRLDNNQ